MTKLGIDCRTLTNPVNGQVDTSNGTTFGSIAIYNCSTGYNLYGNVSLTCGSDGTWSESPPTCEGKYIFGHRENRQVMNVMMA